MKVLYLNVVDCVEYFIQTPVKRIIITVTDGYGINEEVLNKQNMNLNGGSLSKSRGSLIKEKVNVVCIAL